MINALHPSRLLVRPKCSHGYGSKLSHQDMDRRIWSRVPLSRVPFWGLTHCHMGNKNSSCYGQKKSWINIRPQHVWDMLRSAACPLEQNKTKRTILPPPWLDMWECCPRRPRASISGDRWKAVIKERLRPRLGCSLKYQRSVRDWRDMDRVLLAPAGRGRHCARAHAEGDPTEQSRGG